MPTPRSETPPQSSALMWLVITHVLILPLAGSYLPGGLVRLGGLFGFDAAQSMVPIVAVLTLIVVVFHRIVWQLARKEGNKALSFTTLVLAGVSLSVLFLFGTPAPLVVVVRLIALAI